jgi:hypothetical protein
VGSDEERIAILRRVRNEIREWMHGFIAEWYRPEIPKAF